MSFEYFLEQDNSTKKLSHFDEESLVKNIVKDFTIFNNNRASNTFKANALIDEIFFKSTTIQKSSDKNINWKAKIKMCKIYMFYQTLKAFIWRNVYSNVNSMFDVSGENQDSDNSSNKQKAMIVDILEKMDYQKTCDLLLIMHLFMVNLFLLLLGKRNMKNIGVLSIFLKIYFLQILISYL